MFVEDIDLEAELASGQLWMGQLPQMGAITKSLQTFFTGTGFSIRVPAKKVCKLFVIAPI
jgi:hypothetical protein